MTLPRLIPLVLILPLVACAARIPVPQAAVGRPLVLPEPVPAGVTPLTVEQDRQISG
ncbi:hypothetical protein QBK99_15980 [Corticibacterium sp. UT-5YL-CI-8]|nr:hypothetical protein [Tianweitania sp. UT-5YL-CI-8]